MSTNEFVLPFIPNQILTLKSYILGNDLAMKKLF